MFFLGAAFLLMEVYAINRLALLFGTTWLVSAVAIAVMLVEIVLANLVVGLVNAISGPMPMLRCSRCCWAAGRSGPTWCSARVSPPLSATRCSC
jgi:hypothetical protein